VVNKRILVRKTIHQLGAVDIDFHEAFTKPLLVRDEFVKNWDKNIENLSAEEVADLETARDNIAHYEKVYNIFEYCSEINDVMYALESRISSNNPSHPLNVYRWSPSNSTEALLPEVVEVLEAYYQLMDECKEYPDWSKKLEIDLGGVVSFLALQLGEESRDYLVEQYPAYARFDAEKQLYFK
jgi:hypothetical protein